MKIVTTTLQESCTWAVEDVGFLRDVAWFTEHGKRFVSFAFVWRTAAERFSALLRKRRNGSYPIRLGAVFVVTAQLSINSDNCRGYRKAPDWKKQRGTRQTVLHVFNNGIDFDELWNSRKCQEREYQNEPDLEVIYNESAHDADYLMDTPEREFNEWHGRTVMALFAYAQNSPNRPEQPMLRTTLDVARKKNHLREATAEYFWRQDWEEWAYAQKLRDELAAAREKAEEADSAAKKVINAEMRRIAKHLDAVLRDDWHVQKMLHAKPRNYRCRIRRVKRFL